MDSRGIGTYFGEPWPSGVCDDGRRVATPVGEPCASCGEPIEEDSQGSFLVNGHDPALPRFLPQHRECSLRVVLGGIGHLEDHDFWCGVMHDPDGGRTRRQSGQEVWRWVQTNGIPH